MNIPDSIHEFISNNLGEIINVFDDEIKEIMSVDCSFVAKIKKLICADCSICDDCEDKCKNVSCRERDQY